MNNMRVIGAGTIPSGEYNNVSIIGAGEIKGDIKLNKMFIAGAAECDGNINANNINIAGSCECKSNVTVLNELKVSGSGEFNGDIVSDLIKISGTAEVKGNINFNIMKVLGVAEITGDCQGNEFYSNSCSKINGLLSADKVEIKLLEDSYIKEIGGGEITVAKYDSSKKFTLIKISAKGDGNLTSELIEGDKINLEYTICDRVSGHNIIIGKNCEIKKVEYTGSLEIDKSSKVEEIVNLVKK